MELPVNGITAGFHHDAKFVITNDNKATTCVVTSDGKVSMSILVFKKRDTKIIGKPIILIQSSDNQEAFHWNVYVYIYVYPVEINREHFVIR